MITFTPPILSPPKTVLTPTSFVRLERSLIVPEFADSTPLDLFDRDGVLVEAASHTGGKWTLTQWVHCEFVASFEAICPVITQQVCGEFF